MSAKAYGINDDYYFELSRKAGAEKWILQELKSLSEPDEEGSNPGYRRYGNKSFRNGTFVDPTHLQRIIKLPHFTFEDAAPVSRNGRELVEVKFRFDVPEDVSKLETLMGEAMTDSDTVIRSGTLLLDPDNYWLIQEAEAAIHYPSDEVGTVTVEIEYDYDLAEIPIVTRYTARTKAKPAGPKAAELGITEPGDWERTWVFDVSRLEDADEEDFMLTAYGLPEPPIDRGSPTWVWWALAGGALLVLIALLIRYRTARAARN